MAHIIHNETEIDINMVQTDPTNPNEMTDLQMDGLIGSLTRFGFVEPIIIDQDGLIADGEHRFLAWKNLGNESIKAIRLQLSSEERKLLRQSMNKLRGQHEIHKDVDELKNLIDNYNTDVVALLIGQTPESLDYLISQSQDATDITLKEIENNGEKIISTNDRTFDIKCPECGKEFNI